MIFFYYIRISLDTPTDNGLKKMEYKDGIEIERDSSSSSR